jgi:multicomponent Na+:H+ antiporter subunit E
MSTRSQPGNPRATRPPRRLFVQRLAIFAAFWVVLTEGDLRYWWLSAAIVTAAAWASARLVPWSLGIRLPHAFAFLRFFLVYSFRGGVDVAKRALRVAPDLRPGTIDLDLRIPVGGARTFFLLVLGLLPGTLCAGLDGDRARIHVLDTDASTEPQLRALEEHVAATFGRPLEN